MKKVIYLLFLSQMVNSCFLMPLGAPHTHNAENVSKSNPGIKLRIICTPHYKEYAVSGNEENDSVYISSSKMKKKHNFCKTTDFFGKTTKIYSLRTGDYNFHRNLLIDTIEVKIIKADLTIENYNFLVLNNNHTKN